MAYALPVFFQQFIVYPLIASKLGAELNGRFQVALALNYFAISITVTILVNVRLLNQKKYDAAGVKGDFNIFLLIFAAINSLVIIGGSLFYDHGSFTVLDLLLSVVVVLLFTYHDYILVQYRVELRFRNILINNILLCIGYLIGLAVMYYVLPQWQMVFIVPYAITAVYDYCHTDYIKEPVKKTPLFKDTANLFLVYLGTGLIGTVLTYGDKLILYPMMDGTTVSIYTTAGLIGKMLAILTTPMSSFLFAYIVKINTKKFHFRWSYFWIMAVGSILLYFGCIIISGPMLRFLYPDWAEESLAYVSLTAASGVLGLIGSIVNLPVMSFCRRKWQIIKGAITTATHLAICFPMLYFFGLRGYLIGGLINSVFGLLLTVFVLSLEHAVVWPWQKVTPETDISDDSRGGFDHDK